MIYIQSYGQRTLPHHFDAACALYGADELGLKTRLTTIEEVSSGKFDMLIRSNLFVGSSDYMKEVFKRLGIEDLSLPLNSNRAVIETTLGEAFKTIEAGGKIFVKPVQAKLFGGLVVDNTDQLTSWKLPLDTEVLVYEPYTEKIVSEWRIYVHNHKMVDSRNYAGDFTLSPNYDYVRFIIGKNRDIDFPCAYTLDIAIFEDGNSDVVEFNDMWAIGNYGMPNDLYLTLLQDRYNEIIEQRKEELLKYITNT